jgi:hypothetical protein
MKIEYGQEGNGWLLTDCPHGANITGARICKVGSASCTEDCKYFIKNDKKNRVLTCGHPPLEAGND